MEEPSSFFRTGDQPESLDYRTGAGLRPPLRSYTAQPLYGRKVLVVDDDPLIRLFVRFLLKPLGPPVVVEADNGEAAVEMYERERPDLVLLDVDMPKLNGIDALKRIKAHDPDSRVILLTASVSRQAMVSARELGAANFLRKDTPAEELARVLAETIGVCFAA
jgi:two-component system chemotaxis response regulator CheY